MNAHWAELFRYSIFTIFMYYLYSQIMFCLLNIQVKKYLFIIIYYLLIAVPSIIYDHILFSYLNHYGWYIPLSELLHFTSFILLLWIGYYLFSDSLLKIALAIIISDLAIALIHILSISVIRLAFRQPPYMSSSPGTGLAFPLAFISAYLLYRIVIAIGKRWFSLYQKREPQHRLVLSVICIVFICWSQVMFLIARYQTPLVIITILVTMFFTIIIALIIRNKRLNQQYYYLALQQTLLEEHYITLLNHANITAEFYSELNHYINDVKHFSETTTPSTTVRQYANDLLATYNHLACENYCSNPIINYSLNNIVNVEPSSQLDVVVDFDNFNAGSIATIDILGILHHLYSYILNSLSKSSDLATNSLLIKSYCHEQHLIIEFDLNTSKKTNFSHPAIELVQNLAQKNGGSLKMRTTDYGVCFFITLSL